MDDLYREFEHQLARWQTRYAEWPEGEMLRLSLLALEREANVVVAYDDAVIAPRLRSMPLGDETRELFRGALARVWNDEAMHATYIRGALLNRGGLIVGARTGLQQLAGALGGWTVAVRQHLRWSDAPLSCAAATALVWAGVMTGRVPPQVRRQIGYSSFRDFCRHNVTTEGTAWLCWQRLTRLALQVPSCGGEQVEVFRTIAEDEHRHRRIFTVLADALTDDDALQPDVTPDVLGARLWAVEACAAPGADRCWRAAQSPSTARTSTMPHSMERSDAA